MPYYLPFYYSLLYNCGSAIRKVANSPFCEKKKKVIGFDSYFSFCALNYCLDNYMISINNEFFKQIDIILEKISYYMHDRYLSCDLFIKITINESMLSQLNCPYCNCNTFKYNSHYFRIVIEYDALIASRSVCYIITRYKCTGCDKIHALLPDFIFPYKSFSPSLAAEIIIEIVVKGRTYSSLCTPLDVTLSTIKKIHSYFKLNQAYILKSSIEWINLNYDYFHSTNNFTNFIYLFSKNLDCRGRLLNFILK